MDAQTPGAPRPAPRRFGLLETGLLGILYLFTVAAVAGYGIFALHPERLPDSEAARWLFTNAFEGFARLHVLLAAAVLAGVLVRHLGIRWIVPFAAVYAVSFAAEHVGTGYGVPFGGYSYSGLLGYKLGGRVPALIPASWFLMALPAWVLAQAALPGRSSRLGRVALGSLWLVSWDLALDPAMSALTPYWSWHESGAYYGMPWVNLVGWYLTGLAILGVLEAFSSRVVWSRLSTRWIAGYYAAILLMPLGMLAAAGAWLAVLTTALAVSSCAGLSGALALPVRSPAGPPRVEGAKA